MTSREKVKPEVGTRTNALLRALATPGVNDELIAQRARRLLAFMPGHLSDRHAWLYDRLGNKKLFDRTVAALNASSAPVDVTARKQTAQSEPPVASTGRQARTARRRSR